MGSSRLPGKVLVDVGGVPLLQRLLDRLRAVNEIDDIIVATTTETTDDVLADWLRVAGHHFYRGSSDDVLDRFVKAASGHDADFIVRITGDDPLKDPSIVSTAIRLIKANSQTDYVSNTIEPTWPEGLDIEVLRTEALIRAHREAKQKSDREHVTSYIWNRPHIFTLKNFHWHRNLSHWRWTVDKPADLELIRRIFNEFADKPLVSYTEIVEWLEIHPELQKINIGTVRNEGYLKSLQAEKNL